jgi:hypothetical protein
MDAVILINSEGMLQYLNAPSLRLFGEHWASRMWVTAWFIPALDCKSIAGRKNLHCIAKMCSTFMQAGLDSSFNIS